MVSPILLIVLTLLIITAYAAVRLTDLLACGVILGIFSMLMGVLYLLLDAPDVALTEAAVGAGISTVLFVLALSFIPRHEKPHCTKHSATALLIVSITGALLLYTVDGLPPFAFNDAPIHLHVAPYYLTQTQNDIAIPNIVTAILASYRGFDTMGETAVIFTAAIGMAALLFNLPQYRRVSSTAQTTASAKKKKSSKKKEGDA